MHPSTNASDVQLAYAILQITSRPAPRLLCGNDSSFKHGLSVSSSVGGEPHRDSDYSWYVSRWALAIGELLMAVLIFGIPVSQHSMIYSVEYYNLLAGL